MAEPNLRRPGPPKSDLKYIIGGCRVCKKFEGPAAPMGRNIVSRKSPVGWINMRAYNFFVCGPKFTTFLTLDVGVKNHFNLITCFSDFRCLEIFRSYLRSKSIDVRNRGVPRRQPHRRSGLASLPSVGAVP